MTTQPYQDQMTLRDELRHRCQHSASSRDIQLMACAADRIDELEQSGDMKTALLAKYDMRIQELSLERLPHALKAKLESAESQIAYLERQLAEAQKNAERYLFVRNETSNLDFGLINNGWILEGSKADEIIDAAIAQQKVKS